MFMNDTSMFEIPNVSVASSHTITWKEPHETECGIGNFHTKQFVITKEHSEKHISTLSAFKDMYAGDGSWLNVLQNLWEGVT